MTQWTEYRVDMAQELEQRCIDRWSELWEFNGGVEPKFWFGDQVETQRYWARPKETAIVAGMYWQNVELSSQGSRIKRGWIYRFIFSDNSMGWAHQDCLEMAIVQTEGEKCQGF